MTTRIVHQHEGTIAVRRAEVVKESDVLKDHARMLKGPEALVKGIVVEVLPVVERTVSAELDGSGQEGRGILQPISC